jgi:hypothetical protein
MVTLYAMTGEATRWLLLSYRLPREPTRLRLAVWRRLKRVGAVPLHGAIWTVPLDAKTREDFEWLAEEIEEAGGTTLLWVAESLSGQQDQSIAARLRREAENRYAGLAASARTLAHRESADTEELRAALRALGRLERALRLEHRRDYFRAPGRQAAQEAIAEAATTLRARIDAHALGDSAALPR